MSQELHYTSAPRGLTPGTRGFCTVARTADLSKVLAERLESLSGYRQVFPPHHPSETLNPVVYSHLRLANSDQSVLSRIGFAGLDYSDRANKYAHHVIISAGERPRGGPAWLASQPGFLDSHWQGEPRILLTGRVPARGDQAPGICKQWQVLAGDSGWAGALAQAFLEHPERPAYLVFRPGMNLLPLFAEALALLPPERRWQVTFSTYFTGLHKILKSRRILQKVPHISTNSTLHFYNTIKPQQFTEPKFPYNGIFVGADAKVILTVPP